MCVHEETAMSAHLALSMQDINLLKEKSTSKDLEIVRIRKSVESLKDEYSRKDLKVKELEDILKSHERVKMEYIWRINDMNTRIFLYDGINSSCFSLSSKHKLQLNASCDEFDNFSLYLYCVDSIYDPILKWPLNVDITFILMHPDGDNVPVMVQHSFQNGDVEGCEAYIMSMYSMEQYIIDDSLFVKCVVAVVDL